MVSQFGRDTVGLPVAAVLVTMCLLLLGGCGREIHTLLGHPGEVNTVAFSPNGERLAAGGTRRTQESRSGSPDNLVIWDVKTGNRLHSYSVNAAMVHCVAFSPDGQQLAAATSSEDAPVIVFAADADREIFRLNGLAWTLSLAYSADGKRLAAGDRKGTVKVCDTATGDELLTLPKRDTCINSVAFSPDGEQLATYATSGGGVRVWDAISGKELKHLLRGSLDFGMTINNKHDVAFSPDGKRLAACEEANDIVRVWDLDTEEQVLSLVGPISDDWGVSGVAVTYSPNGKWIAWGSSDNIVRLWGAETGEERVTLRGHKSPVNDVAFSPDNKRLASASDDGTVKVWRLSD